GFLQAVRKVVQNIAAAHIKNGITLVIPYTSLPDFKLSIGNLAEQTRSLQRLQVNLAEVKGAAFALDADVAVGDIHAGDFVHGLAVDDDLHGVAPADALEGGPFAERAFVGRLEHFDSVPAHVGGFLRGNPALEPEVAHVIVHSLAFEAMGPDLLRARRGIAILHEDQHAGVDGFRGIG